MSMLAERKHKQKFSLNPRGKLWSEDKNKFGQKMLEKMGWSEGKGLGVNEDGIKEHIHLRIKNDSEGVGYKEIEGWTEHDSNFNAILENLNQSSNIVATSTKPQSLEQKSQNSRVRVHYHKFTRGKDLSQYSEKDLASIFGKKSLNDNEQYHQEKQYTREQLLVVNSFKTNESENTNKQLIEDNDEYGRFEEDEKQKNIFDSEEKRKKKKKNKTIETVEDCNDNAGQINSEENIKNDLITKKKKKKVLVDDEKIVDEEKQKRTIETIEEQSNAPINSEEITKKKKKSKTVETVEGGNDNTGQINSEENLQNDLIAKKKKKKVLVDDEKILDEEKQKRTIETIEEHSNGPINSEEITKKKKKNKTIETVEDSNDKAGQIITEENLKNGLDIEKKKKKKKVLMDDEKIIDEEKQKVTIETVEEHSNAPISSEENVKKKKKNKTVETVEGGNDNAGQINSEENLQNDLISKKKTKKVLMDNEKTVDEEKQKITIETIEEHSNALISSEENVKKKKKNKTVETVEGGNDNAGQINSEENLKNDLIPKKKKKKVLMADEKTVDEEKQKITIETVEEHSNAPINSEELVKKKKKSKTIETVEGGDDNAGPINTKENLKNGLNNKKKTKKVLMDDEKTVDEEKQKKTIETIEEHNNTPISSEENRKKKKKNKTIETVEGGDDNAGSISCEENLKNDLIPKKKKKKVLMDDEKMVDKEKHKRTIETIEENSNAPINSEKITKKKKRNKIIETVEDGNDNAGEINNEENKKKKKKNKNKTTFVSYINEEICNGNNKNKKNKIISETIEFLSLPVKIIQLTAKQKKIANLSNFTNSENNKTKKRKSETNENLDTPTKKIKISDKQQIESGKKIQKKNFDKEDGVVNPAFDPLFSNVKINRHNLDPIKENVDETVEDHATSIVETKTKKNKKLRSIENPVLDQIGNETNENLDTPTKKKKISDNQQVESGKKKQKKKVDEDGVVNPAFDPLFSNHNLEQTKENADETVEDRATSIVETKTKKNKKHRDCSGGIENPACDQDYSFKSDPSIDSDVLNVEYKKKKKSKKIKIGIENPVCDQDDSFKSNPSIDLNIEHKKKKKIKSGIENPVFNQVANETNENVDNTNLYEVKRKKTKTKQKGIDNPGLNLSNTSETNENDLTDNLILNVTATTPTENKKSVRFSDVNQERTIPNRFEAQADRSELFDINTTVKINNLNEQHINVDKINFEVKKGRVNQAFDLNKIELNENIESMYNKLEVCHAEVENDLNEAKAQRRGQKRSFTNSYDCNDEVMVGRTKWGNNQRSPNSNETFSGRYSAENETVNFNACDTRMVKEDYRHSKFHRETIAEMSVQEEVMVGEITNSDGENEMVENGASKLRFKYADFGKKPLWLRNAKSVSCPKKSYRHLIKGDIIVNFKNSNLYEIEGYAVSQNKE